MYIIICTDLDSPRQLPPTPGFDSRSSPTNVPRRRDERHSLFFIALPLSRNLSIATLSVLIYLEFGLSVIALITHSFRCENKYV